MRKRDILLSVSFAILLTMATFTIQFYGWVYGQYGNACGVSANEACIGRVLQAGLPLPFMTDTPGVSIVGHLGFFEDDIHIPAFIADVLIFTLLFCGLFVVAKKPLAERAKRGSRAKFDAVLAKVPDVPPDEQDKL